MEEAHLPLKNTFQPQKRTLIWPFELEKMPFSYHEWPVLAFELDYQYALSLFIKLCLALFDLTNT